MAENKNSQGILIIIITAIIAFSIWWYYKHRKEQEDVSGGKPIVTQSIEIVQEKSDASFYPTFVSGKDNKVRYNSPSFSYNPATNTLSSANFKGNLQGSVSNIDVQDIPDVIIQPRAEKYHQTGYYGIERFSFQNPNVNQGRFRGDVVQPDSVSDLATPSDLVTPSGAVKAGQYFLPLVGAAGPNQQLRARNALKYDVASNTITATTNYANNISGGAAGQIPYQATTGITEFVPLGENNSILVYDGVNKKPVWKPSATITGTTGAVSNIAKPAGSVLYQSANNTTDVLAGTTAADAYLSFSAGKPVWRTFTANPANAGTVNVVALA